MLQACEGTVVVLNLGSFIQKSVRSSNKENIHNAKDTTNSLEDGDTFRIQEKGTDRQRKTLISYLKNTKNI